MVDFALLLASQKKIAQLPRSDLKYSLDELCDVIGSPRTQPTNRTRHNESAIQSYLRMHIKPLTLVNCTRGNIRLSTLEVRGEHADVAAKGLYLLEGKIALYPLRSQKKVGPLKYEDVEIARRFFMDDLLCNPDSWEGWYRLAQTMEVQLEDWQTWSADRMNSNRQDIAVYERCTIHAYARAVSLSISEGVNDEALAGLYVDFASRIYASSRPPMDGECFSLAGFERHFSGRSGEGMYKSAPHSAVSMLQAMKFAVAMLQRALELGEKKSWKVHYIMGKALGKLYREYLAIGEEGLLGPEDVLEKFVDAVKWSPDKVGQEYVFEPHHKLLSAACKYVLEDQLEVSFFFFKKKKS